MAGARQSRGLGCGVWSRAERDRRSRLVRRSGVARGRGQAHSAVRGRHTDAAVSRAYVGCRPGLTRPRLRPRAARLPRCLRGLESTVPHRGHRAAGCRHHAHAVLPARARATNGPALSVCVFQLVCLERDRAHADGRTSHDEPRGIAARAAVARACGLAPAASDRPPQPPAVAGRRAGRDRRHAPGPGGAQGTEHHARRLRGSARHVSAHPRRCHARRRWRSGEFAIRAA